MACTPEPGRYFNSVVLPAGASAEPAACQAAGDLTAPAACSAQEVQDQLRDQQEAMSTGMTKLDPDAMGIPDKLQGAFLKDVISMAPWYSPHVWQQDVRQVASHAGIVTCRLQAPRADAALVGVVS